MSACDTSPSPRLEKASECLLSLEHEGRKIRRMLLADASRAVPRRARPQRAIGEGDVSYSVIVLSARAGNLVACVRSVLANEPGLPPDRVIVVDDGARTEAEPLLPPVRWLTGIKPFVFARNANLGIRAADGDVILLNDDARLVTPGGFAALVQQARRDARVGICSAGIRGKVGNPRQNANGGCELRIEPVTLAFVCVYIPRAVFERLGGLDERFSGYGFDDNDYCARALEAGLELAVWDGC